MYALAKKMRRGPILALALLITSGWQVVAQTASPDVNDAPPKGERVYAVYKGTLPCADCPGIETTVTLYTKGPYNFSDARFRMVQKYLDRPEAKDLITSGRWYVSKGTADDPRATAYQLHTSKPDQEINFVRTPDGLQLLDKDRHMLNPANRFTLHKASQK